jgi:hypothetical protein
MASRPPHRPYTVLLNTARVARTPQKTATPAKPIVKQVKPVPVSQVAKPKPIVEQPAKRPSNVRSALTPAVKRVIRPVPQMPVLPPPARLRYIDGFTCCTGALYAEQLKRSLPVWNDTLDSITIVTRSSDAHVIAACKPYRKLRLVFTDVFDQHGAHFNKGAALNVAYAAMDPLDGVLHFDSDILPPPDWRARVEREFRVGTIVGTDRSQDGGQPIVDKGPKPYGFFQLWHATDPAAQFWPLFEPWHPHAGNYDIEFLEHWHPKTRVILPFHVIHFGEPRKNWFGVAGDEQADSVKFRQMEELNNANLHHVRMASRKPENRLKVPDFKLKLCLRGEAGWARAMIRACMTDDPFLVSARIGQLRPDEQLLTVTTSLEKLRERISKLRG